MNLKARISSQGRELMNGQGGQVSIYDCWNSLGRTKPLEMSQWDRAKKKNLRMKLQQGKTETVPSHFTPPRMLVSPSFPCGYYGFGMNAARWWGTYFNGIVRKHTDKLPPISATAVEFISLWLQRVMGVGGFKDLFTNTESGEVS